jgi:hypothetical protein
MDLNMILIYSVVIGFELILLIGIILLIKKHINKHKANDPINSSDINDNTINHDNDY